MSHLVLVGVSHRTAPVELREQIALDADSRRDLGDRLLATDGLQETVILSTCNRTEVYAVATGADHRAVTDGIVSQLLARVSEHDGDARDVFRVADGPDVVRHACEVASGLDSLVLGETQILGQVRGAYEEAVAWGTVGSLLGRLFPATLQLAKKAHTDTSISVGSASIGSIAVDLAAKVFDDLPRRTALLLGAGDTGETIARALTERKIARLLIAGRGTERSTALAERLGATAIPLDAAMERLPEADIVLTAASVSDGSYVLSRDRLEQVVKVKHRGDLLVIDVGVPRNVDPAAVDVADLFLYDVDDLQAVAEETRRRRLREVPKVRSLIDRAVDSYVNWWRTAVDVGPLLRDLHGHFRSIAESELRRTLSRLPPEHHADVETLSRSMIDKLLQRPTIYLKQRPVELAEIDALLRRLFALGGGREDE